MAQIPYKGGWVAVVLNYLSAPTMALPSGRPGNLAVSVVVEVHPVLGWRDIPPDKADAYDFVPLLADRVIDPDEAARIGFIHDSGRVTDIDNIEIEWPSLAAFIAEARQSWAPLHHPGSVHSLPAQLGDDGLSAIGSSGTAGRDALHLHIDAIE